MVATVMIELVTDRLLAQVPKRRIHQNQYYRFPRELPTSGNPQPTMAARDDRRSLLLMLERARPAPAPTDAILPRPSRASAYRFSTRFVPPRRDGTAIPHATVPSAVLA
jgi:hypothetical protein